MKIIALAFFLGFSFQVSAVNICQKLANPRGVAITTLIYGTLSAISNFMWAFNWQGHMGMSAELSAKLQEMGGLSASAENIILGVFVPALVWGYVTKEQEILQKPKQTFMQFMRGRDACPCPMAGP